MFVARVASLFGRGDSPCCELIDDARGRLTHKRWGHARRASRRDKLVDARPRARVEARSSRADASRADASRDDASSSPSSSSRETVGARARLGALTFDDRRESRREVPVRARDDDATRETDERDDRAQTCYRVTACLDATDNDDVYVGRIRQDISQPNNKGLDLFVCGDQIKKGAALNAVQCAELLLK